MATIVGGEGLDKTEIILVGFTGFCIIFQGFYSAVISGVPRQVFSSTIGMIPDLPNKARHISYQIYHSFTAWPLLRNHSRKSMLLIWSYNCSKSSWLETRNGWSNTKLLFSEGWWYCRAPVSVLCLIKSKEKLIVKTVGWLVKIRLSCARRLAGLMAERWKWYQSWSLLWRLNRVRICGQCCCYVWATSSSELETRFEGIRTGSACQLELAVAADAWEAEWGVAGGSDNELPLAWAFLLDCFAAGASFEVVTLHLRLFVCCCWWAVRTCTL